MQRLVSSGYYCAREKRWKNCSYHHEQALPTSCDRIKQTNGPLKKWSVLCRQLDEICASISVDGSAPIRAKMKEIVPESSYELAFGSAPGSVAEGIRALVKAAGQKV